MKRGRGSLRWWMIGLVMLGTILNYLTRSTLGVAAPAMLPDLGITPRQYSYITGAFQIGIMFQTVAGYLLDVIGLRYGLALFAGTWSLIAAAHGLATNWIALAGLRGAMGLAEGSAQPGGLKVVSEWFPAKERGFASGIYNIGASFGSMLAPPLVVASIYFWNWQGAFVVTGALGLMWVGLWLLFYRPMLIHPFISPAERDYIVAGQEQAPPIGAGERPRLGALLRRRNVWGIAIPRLLADPTWGTLTFWLPLYLTTVRGFNLGQIALFAWLPFVTADLGCLFGPALAAWLQRRGFTLINARRSAFTVGALMMTSMIFVGFVESPYAAIALLCIGGFAHQTLSISCITMASDLFPTNEVGTVAGIAGTCANLGVLIFSLAIGLLVATIGYSPFFVALGLLDLAAAAVLWTVVKDPRRDVGA
ncbi:MAG TPA: MFS transporter [Sphingomonas sp.]|nr:MFS transporter [Sphingomonas sp.]